MILETYLQVASLQNIIIVEIKFVRMMIQFA